MKRYYLSCLQEYLDKKIILLTGPRQCGKTTASKMLRPRYDYINFDAEEDRRIIREKSWDRKKSLLIFDEIHKMKNWKQWLKGVFDTEGLPPSIIVTGSARLDTYKKVGDSLAGRYFSYRMHPLDVRELKQINPRLSLPKELDKLMLTGGFPEPYIEGTEKFYNLWKKTHLDIILKQDLVSQEDVKDIMSLELLVNLLQERVGSPISYSSLARDLQCSDKTVKRWLTILENMYVVFRLTPFHRNIAQSNLKQPKYYFYDVARANASEGARLENIVASSLLKECHYRQDCLGEKWVLHYLSKKGGGEVDFLITREGQPTHAIEVKLSDDSPSKSLLQFAKDLPAKTQKVQLVKNLKREKTFPNGLEIREAAKWLGEW